MNTKTSLFAALAALLMSTVTLGTTIAPVRVVASTPPSANAHA